MSPPNPRSRPRPPIARRVPALSAKRCPRVKSAVRADAHHGAVKWSPPHRTRCSLLQDTASSATKGAGGGSTGRLKSRRDVNRAVGSRVVLRPSARDHALPHGSTLSSHPHHIVVRRSTTPRAPPRASSLARARQAFQDVEFHPSILRNVPVVDTSREVLGGPSALPFGIAPTGFTRLMQTEGEIAGAGAAGAAGIPFTLSTLGTTSIEDVKAANPNGRNWFQLYVMKDREISYELAPRGRRRLRHPVLHGRHARRRRPPARQAQRLLDPAAAHARHGHQRAPAPGVVDQLPHDPEARVRLALVDRRHRRRAARLGDGPDDLVRRPRRHPRDLAGQDRRQGRADRRGREAPRRPRRRRHRALEPRRPPARPRADPVPPAAARRARGRQRHRGAHRHRAS